MVKNGDHVTYIDETKVQHDALVTNTFGAAEHGGTPAINIVYVSTLETETDPYGRQLKRQTSVVHIDNNSAQANCWK